MIHDHNKKSNFHQSAHTATSDDNTRSPLITSTRWPLATSTRPPLITATPVPGAHPHQKHTLVIHHSSHSRCLHTQHRKPGRRCHRHTEWCSQFHREELLSQSFSVLLSCLYSYTLGHTADIRKFSIGVSQKKFFYFYRRVALTLSVLGYRVQLYKRKQETKCSNSHSQ